MPSTLERLEEKHGLEPRTMADAAAVREKAMHAPHTLTALDHATLEFFGAGKQAADAMASYARYLEANATPPIVAEAGLVADALTVDIDGTRATVTGDVLIAVMGKLLKHATDEIKTLEARVAVLEERPTFEYKGVWESNTAYRAGDFATKNGHLWASKSHVNYAEPGTTSDWQLAVRAGRDGRDRR